MKNKTKEAHRYSSYYSQKGDYATRRVAQAISRKSWHWTLLNLAWTAGPVTFLAIYIGHKLGFGGGPSFSTLIYFASYTTVVGLCAVMASIIREAFYQPRVEEEKKLLLENIDAVFNLTLRIRDLNLASLPLEERKIMAAYYTLQSAGCSPPAIKEAVYNLTASEKLSRAVERVLAYDEQGMHSLVEATLEKHKEELGQVQQYLQEIAPITFDLLMQWMKGNAPNSRSGRPRDEGFLQRTLNAANENDPDLMTLTDAYETASLIFELLNGYRISVLETHFSGDRKIAKAKRRLDAATRKYRLALRTRNSQIRLVLDEIDSSGLIDRLPETARSGPVLLNTLVVDIQSLRSGERKQFKKPFELIQALHKTALTASHDLLLARQRYRETVRSSGEKLSIELDESDLKRAGFYIDQSTIHLDDDQKIQLAHHIDSVVEREPSTLNDVQVKESVMELATELDSLIDISRVEVQVAIESSNALQLGYLRRSYTPATKVGWAQKVIEDMHQNQKRASHQLAKKLVTFYAMNLSESVIELFSNAFGADPEYLKSLRGISKKETPTHSLLLPEIKDLPTWQQLQNDAVTAPLS